MCCDDVVCLGESFLSDLPVATQNLGDVRRLVALFVRKQGEVIRQVADEIFKWFGPSVGVDENESAPATDLDFRE